MLVEEALAGRPEAFRKIVEKHQDGLYGLCLRMTGKREDAEDAVQEAFLAVFNRLPEYQPGHKLSNWLYTVALNRCRSLLRRRRILRFFSLDGGPNGNGNGDGDGEGLLGRLQSLDDPPDAGLEREGAEGLARRMIERLPDTLKAPFILRHLERMPYDDIARVLGLSLEAVKVRLHRAKLLLWKEFGAELGVLR